MFLDKLEVEGMSEREKEDYTHQQAFDYMMNNMISWTWYEDEE